MVKGFPRFFFYWTSQQSKSLVQRENLLAKNKQTQVFFKPCSIRAGWDRRAGIDPTILVLGHFSLLPTDSVSVHLPHPTCNTMLIYSKQTQYSSIASRGRGGGLGISIMTSHLKILGYQLVFAKCPFWPGLQLLYERNCGDRDQKLVSMITLQFTFEKSDVFIITNSTLSSLLFKGLIATQIIVFEEINSHCTKS